MDGTTVPDPKGTDKRERLLESIRNPPFFRYAGSLDDLRQKTLEEATQEHEWTLEMSRLWAVNNAHGGKVRLEIDPSEDWIWNTAPWMTSNS
jgi:hypothetical protein